MSDSVSYPDLIRQAQLGSRDSVERLAQLAQGRVFAHIFRLTLDRDLSQDISQETLLEMVRSLKRLNFERADQFWSWLFRTATGKVQHYFRDKQNKKAIQLSMLDEERLLQRTLVHRNDGLNNMISKELSHAIFKAMAKLKLKYRSVLLLRCLEKMPYSQIADIMGCSEMYARAMFFRAKRLLKRRLSRDGFGRQFLLPALWLFGRVTAPAEAAPASTSVAAASMKVGLTGTIIGAAGTKLGITVATVITATALTVGGITAGGGRKLAKGSRVTSFHYVEHVSQARGNGVDSASIMSKGLRERWYYFPDGIEGPLFARIQAWDSQYRVKNCSWLRNSQGNYYYRAAGTDPPTPARVYIINDNYASSIRLRTLRLPSDPPGFTEFLDRVEGKISKVIYSRNNKTSLLVSKVDNRFADTPNFRTVYKYNCVDKAFFNFDWSEDVPVVDERDAMHKRGWTYFRVTGEIGEDKVQGWGQIPFIYDAIVEHPPWLKLQVAEKLEIVDIGSGAYLVAPEQTAIAAYPSGTFFNGLAKPWMGMHAIDSVRREAAEKKMTFEIELIDDEMVQVTLFEDMGSRQIQLIYEIHGPKDLVEEIEFLTYDGARREIIGQLRFTYLEEVAQVANEFIAPEKATVPSETAQENMGISWLIELAQGTLGQ
jgi:RNA polymerase sigma-70 factor (ECF subfamily)